MEKLKAKILSCNVLIVLLLLAAPWPVMSQEVDDEREFSYDAESENGPHNWGEIRPEWSACSNGRLQSPIDLLNERVETVTFLRGIQRYYKPSNATLINRGHDIMLRWEDAGYILINGTQYDLHQCHWHSPSEHTIDGRRFDLEAHLVHESRENNTAVIGIMYEIGRPDSFLGEINDQLRAIADEAEEQRAVGVVDPNHIELGSRHYYRYIGSLTVPPCTQNVDWTIMRQMRPVGREQVRLLREAVDDDSESNARPVQPTNGRSVQLHRPKVFRKN